MKWILYGVLLLSSLIYAEEYEADSYETGAYQMASTEGDPSGLILGCASALSGEYFYSESSAFVAGATPFYFQHFYSSGLSNNSESGLVYMPYLYMEYDIGATHKKKPSKVWIYEKTGGKFVYELDEKCLNKILHHKKLDVWEYHFVEDTTNDWGVTNTAHGTISARNNPKNNVVLENREDHSFEVHSPDGTTRLYKYSHKSVDGPTWSPNKITVYTRRAYLEFERLPNGHVIKYEWEAEVKGTRKLKKIRVLADSSPYDFVCIDLKHNTKIPDEDHSFYFDTSDGKRVGYQYKKAFGKKDKTFRWRISEISSPDLPYEKLTYHPDLSHKWGMIEGRHFPNNHQIHLEYYKKGMNEVLGEPIDIKYQDPRCHRIKTISLPMGDHDDLVDIMTFIHHPGEPGKTGGSTETFDAYQNRTVYHYSPEIRLQLIEKFTDGQQNTLWQKERLTWDGINLVNRSTLLPDDKALLSKRYFYDEKGNVKEEKWVGNFSGRKGDSHSLKEGLPVEEEAETFSTFYTFIDVKYDNRTAENQIRSIEKENGLKTVFFYQPDSAQIAAKLISYNGKVRQRHFYFYDALHLLNREVVDDGSSEDFTSSTDVSERKTLHYTHKNAPPYFGMPETVVETYYDSATHEDALLKKYTLSYTTGGKVDRETIFDAEGVERFSVARCYDGQGRVVKESDAMGRLAEYRYDENNNKTSVKDCGERKESRMKYDLVNRLKSIEEKGDDGLYHGSHYTYDLHNHKTSETDFFGNQTFFIYDALGNLREKRFPTVLDEKGESYEMAELYEVDALGRVVATTNSASDTLQTRYNAYHKPTQIIHPDGTAEHFIYYTDGSLKDFIDQEGIKTSYTYDPLGRETSKTLTGKDGSILFEEHQVYNSFHLIEKSDSTGAVVRYQYDGAGREIMEEFLSKETRLVQLFHYDSLGNLSRTTETGKEGSCHTIKTFDLLKRVLEERIEDDQGSVLSQTSFVYDAAGNLSEIVNEVEGVPTHEYFFYDSFHRLIRSIDAEGKSTYYEYNENFKNELGQRVLQKITIDPSGNKTIETHDALGRCISVLIKDSFGQTLSLEEFFYDRRGQKARQISHVMAHGEETRLVNTLWEYSNMGKLIALTEAAGTHEQKITRYRYSDKGLMTAIIKPDGVEILFEFDERGRNTQIRSTDNSVSYTLTYNESSQLIHSYDNIAHLFFKREYDGMGNLLFEKLSNGLELQSGYDDRGRKTRLTLPDHSSIAYGYGALFPTNVERFSSQGDLLYTHEYNQFDLSGNLLEQTLPKNLGKCLFSTNLVGQTKKSKNRYETYEITQFDERGLPKTTKNHTVRGSDTRHFDYDGLGQLIKEQGSQRTSFAYDSHNNRLNKNQEGYTVNALSQLCSTAESSYQYGLNGNRITKTTPEGTTRFSYDALGRLSKAILTDGTIVTYIYDSLHRRIAKKVLHPHETQSVTTFYLYDDQYEIGEYDENLNPKNLRILGDTIYAEIGAAIALESQGQLLIPLHDIFGNVTALIDSDTQQAVESYEYSSFGEEQIYDAQGLLKQTSTNPWRYMSKYADNDLKLVFFGRRYYDPEIGRWITPDPAGFIDGLNLYAFVLNNPLLFVDLFGLATQLGADGLPRITYEGFEQKLINSAKNFPITSDATKKWIEETYSSRCCDLGRENLKDIRIGFMNGMNASFESGTASAKYVSDLAGGHNVDFIYNATHGFVPDLQEAYKGFKYRATEPVRLLHQTWNGFFKDSPNGIYIMVCHSQGAIHVRNALLDYPDALRKRIIVLAIAPAVYIDERLCRKVNHYRVEGHRDFVPLLDGDGLSRCKGTVTTLQSHPNASWMDHGFMSPTYEPPLKRALVQAVSTHLPMR